MRSCFEKEIKNKKNGIIRCYRHLTELFRNTAKSKWFGSKHFKRCNTIGTILFIIPIQKWYRNTHQFHY